MKLSDYRNEYNRFTLDESGLDPNPRVQFHHWLKEAMDDNAIEPTAMTLSTVNAEGQPTSRIVLLKNYEEDGLRFFTNFDSRKGQDLAHNDRACLMFFWPSLHRQVRFEGRVHKLSAEIADEYFHSRPVESRISALASPQSQPVSRSDLEQRVQALQKQYGDHPPRPENWGGYVLVPEHIEFWQGRSCRLHDRFVFNRTDSEWTVSRLAP
ncbi:pyridoxamine 5'-phosphate oxidase [Paenalcaligenes sp. Me131]|uniref:pyridoxamine 5'-phosphate oxidase n=1 Tax=Paenalcaligenes sp. Me131 TaxID=3392636 RepID=UPI003D29E919